MKAFHFAVLAFAFAFATVAHARPVVIEESATLTRPDAAWTFGRFGVAIDGDFALVSGERNVFDLTTGRFLRQEGVAYLYRRSGVNWIYQQRLGPIGTVPEEKRPGLAMKDGIAVIWTDKTRIYELQGDTWVRIPLPLAIENTMQGPDIDIDGGRILIARNACYQSAVLRKSIGTWNIEGTLPGHDISCSYAGPGNQQDIHGTHAILHNRPGPNGTPEPGVYLSRLNENGVGWRQTRFAERENGRISNASIALNWPNWASAGFAHLGSPVGYELSDGVGAWSPYGLQPVDSYMDSFINLSESTTGIERFRDGFAQRNWSFDRNTYVINLFRINADAARSSEHVATLQPSDGQNLGNQIASSGNRMIVGGWFNGSGNDTVRVFDVPESLEAPPVQVHDFEQASGGAAWQPAPGSTFSVVRVGNSGVYRQASTDGTPSSSLTTTSPNQAIQVEVTTRATVGANAWVGLTTRRAGSSYYYVTLRASGGIELKRLVDGAITTLAATPANFSTGQKYRLRLESVGTLHRVYLDDVSVLTARDATLREGVPGVITNRSSADFDNVIVTVSPLTTITKQPFEDYYTRESWTEHSGTWSPSAGGYQQSSLTDYARAFTGALADDQIVQAHIRPTGFAGPDNWVGLMARYLDERNYLYVSLRARGVISLWRRTNGANTQLATRSMTVTAGTWYTVRVEVVGGLTRVFVNDQLQLSSSADPGPTLPNVSWSKGQVGLITYRATADFGDILAYQP